MSRTIAFALPLLFAFSSGCLPLRGASGGSASLACDDLGAEADAQVIEAYIETGYRFEADSLALAADLEATCGAIAQDLAIEIPSATQSEMQVQATCGAVRDEIHAIVDAALPRDASLELTYDAPVCTVDVDAYAGCVAQCDADFSVEGQIECTEGRLVGECGGMCTGECYVDGTMIETDGYCAGTCAGYCDVELVAPRCEGDIEVEANVQCEAACEARVDLVAECTEPSLFITYDAGVDPEAAARLDVLVASLQENYPHLLALHSRLEAVAASGSELVTGFEGAADAAGRMGMRATACFADSTLVAVESLATVNVSLSVTVEVSASVSATAGG